MNAAYFQAALYKGHCFANSKQEKYKLQQKCNNNKEMNLVFQISLTKSEYNKIEVCFKEFYNNFLIY